MVLNVLKLWLFLSLKLW